MELNLKDRKAIKNGNIKLPGYEDGFGRNNINRVWQMLNDPGDSSFARNNISDTLYDLNEQAAEKATKFQQGIGSAIQSGIGFATSAIDAFTTDMTADKYLANAGTSEGSIGGIKYQRINPIYRDGKLPKYSNGFTDTLGTATSGASFGASVGSIVPGIGTGIGALAGGVLGGITGAIGSIFKSDAEEEAKNAARRKRLAINNFNQSGAMSTYLQMKEQQDLSKPMYAEGKMPLLDTSFGMAAGKPNAKVDKGEWMINTITGDAHKVMRGAGDNALAYVRPEDTILSKKRGAADYFEQTGDLIGAMSMNKKQYSNGKLPKCAEGWLPNTIINGLGGLVGLGQYLSARNEDVKRPATKASNTYEGAVLRGLAGLQYNPYPILNDLKNRQAYLNYGLTNSGGISGAQKYLGKIANAANMYKATADVHANLQDRNIGLRSNLFSTMANLGAQDAQRAQSANQYDLYYYSKAHAAREQAMQTGLFNMLNAAQSWYSNDFKRRQFNDMMNQYRQERRFS